MVEVWEREICMDTSMQGSFRDPEVQILTYDQSVNANIERTELICTVMVLNTPPCPFLQPLESPSSNLPLFPAAHEPRNSRSVEATSTAVICTFQFSARICFWSPDSCSCTATLKIRLPKSGLKCLNLKYLMQIFPISKQPRNTCQADTVSVGEST